MSRLAGTTSGRWAIAVCGGFGAGVCAAFGRVPVAALMPVVVAAASGAAAIVATLVLWRRRSRVAPAVCVLAAVLLGVARGGAAVEAPGPDRIDGHLGPGPAAITGTVRSSAPAGGDAIIDVARLTSSDVDRAMGGGVLVASPTLPQLSPGDVVEVDVTALRAPNRRPGPESASILEREGVQADAVSPQVTVLRRGGVSLPGIVAGIQRRLLAAVDQVLPQPASTLVLGVAFGIRQSLPASDRAALQDSGLIHIVVVSGLKVVLVIGLIAALARARGWPPRHLALVAVPVVLAYVLVSGAGPAAVRSAVMAGIAFGLRRGGRRVDPLASLALVGAGMLAISPEAMLDVGFQLSFLGTAGILLLAEPLAGRLPGPRVLRDPFAVTVAAQIATTPVMAGTFGVISFAGPLANALVLPLLPALIVAGGGGALLAAVAPALGWLPLHLAGLGAALVMTVAQACQTLPGSWIEVATWPLAWTAAELAALAVIAALCLRWHLRPPATADTRRRRLAVLAVAAAVAAGGTGLLASRPDGALHATVLDTGSGTAVLVSTATGGTVLVDGGASSSLLLTALGRVLPPFASRLDMVVLTGGEHAAAAGLGGLPGHYAVGLVVAPDGLTPGATAVLASLAAGGSDVVEAAGRAWTWGDALWRCLPYRGSKTGAGMCALTAAAPDGRLLVLGDAGTDDQDELVAEYGQELHADVLVAPPGGALSPAMLATAAPGTVAVPQAQGAAGSPSPPHVVLLRTGADGDLSFAGGPAGLTEAT